MDGQVNWKALAGQLNDLLRLHSTPIGVQVLKNKAQLGEIDKLRMPTTQLAPCQVMGQAIQKGFTIAVTDDYAVRPHCRVIHGMRPKDDRFDAGAYFCGVWFGNEKAAAAHQAALYTLPAEVAAIVYSPLRSQRIEPDVCVLMLNPAQAFMLLSGLIEDDYKKLEFDFVGESTCSVGWIRTWLTNAPSLTVPCYAELRFGGYPENELILALTPQDLVKAVKGLERLNGAGLRYPPASYAAEVDPDAGMAASYKKKTDDPSK